MFQGIIPYLFLIWPTVNFQKILLLNYLTFWKNQTFKCWIWAGTSSIASTNFFRESNNSNLLPTSWIFAKKLHKLSTCGKQMDGLELSKRAKSWTRQSFYENYRMRGLREILIIEKLKTNTRSLFCSESCTIKKYKQAKFGNKLFR